MLEIPVMRGGRKSAFRTAAWITIESDQLLWFLRRGPLYLMAGGDQVQAARGHSRMSRCQPLARIVLGLTRGSRHVIADHADRKFLNFAFSNIRPVDGKQSTANRDMSCSNASGYRGVSLHTIQPKWVASAGWRDKGGKSRAKYLGYFDLKEDAARAYDAWALTYYGPNWHGFNFPPASAPGQVTLGEMPKTPLDNAAPALTLPMPRTAL